MDMERFVSAIDTGELETVRRSLENDPAVAKATDSKGVSLLLRALYHRQPAVAELLAEHRDELDLPEAAALGRSEAVAAALESDPTSVAQRSPDGFTPLHLAAFFDRRDTAALLLERGADPNAEAANDSRVKPLHSAAAARSLEICRGLLEAGADADSRQAGGFTALHSAALHGQEELVELLLAAGADDSTTADDGRDAAAFAEEGGHSALARRLRGADRARD